MLEVSLLEMLLAYVWLNVGVAIAAPTYAGVTLSG
jgi:hypothetical protein